MTRRNRGPQKSRGTGAQAFPFRFSSWAKRNPAGSGGRSDKGGRRGRPYRVPVNNKNIFSGPKPHTPIKGMRSVGLLLASAVLLRDLNVPKRPGPLVLLRTCSFSWIHSSSPPTVRRRLFRAVIHPDLSQVLLGARTSGPGPIPTRRDQNNVSTAPGSSIRI